MVVEPTREVEKQLLEEIQRRGGRILAAVDEVGRGSLAGPVCVGIALIDETTSDAVPEGLRDSKLLSHHQREVMYDAVHAWPLAVESGMASSEVIDEVGIVEALRRAAGDALKKLADKGFVPDAVLLDGNHDWWNAVSLLYLPDALPPLPVTTVVKGDTACSAIAAASVVAKVDRDTYMEALDADYPLYGWVRNKGYSSNEHIEALAKYGVSPYHRVSWKLPGVKKLDV
ncbi:ribonuclease HII [Actinotignum urinale]|uniref:ribonuclease HII n=1 Tax=Actinotignum urinale TaxID=190146 RepID=UPI00370D0F24